MDKGQCVVPKAPEKLCFDCFAAANQGIGSFSAGSLTFDMSGYNKFIQNHAEFDGDEN